jgi:hypothetical protein
MGGTLITAGTPLWEAVMKTGMGLPLSKREFGELVKHELLVQAPGDGTWHLTEQGTRVLGDTVPTLKRTGRRPKSSAGAMTQADRQREYRQRKWRRIDVARDAPEEASTTALLERLQELIRLGKYPQQIHQVLDEIRRRHPLSPRASVASVTPRGAR